MAQVRFLRFLTTCASVAQQDLKQSLLCLPGVVGEVDPFGRVYCDLMSCSTYPVCYQLSLKTLTLCATVCGCITATQSLVGGSTAS
jgi:hypothetical protein